MYYSRWKKEIGRGGVRGRRGSTEEMKRGRERMNRRQQKTKNREDEQRDWVSGWHMPHAEFVMDYYGVEHGLCSRQTLNRIQKPMLPKWLPHSWFCLFINTLMFFIQLTSTDWNINTFDPENFSLFHHSHALCTQRPESATVFYRLECLRSGWKKTSMGLQTNISYSEHSGP